MVEGVPEIRITIRNIRIWNAEICGQRRHLRLSVVVGRSDMQRQQVARNIDRQVDLAAIGVIVADIAGPHPVGGLPGLRSQGVMGWPIGQPLGCCYTLARACSRSAIRSPTVSSPTESRM